MFPQKVALITIILFSMGIVAGFLSDKLIKPTRILDKLSVKQFSLHDEDHCKCFQKDMFIAQLMYPSIYRVILIVIILFLLIAVLTGLLVADAKMWIKVSIFLALAFSLFVVSCVPEHFLKKHLLEHILKMHLPRNKNVLIIGGGLIGVDIATALIPLNNKVTIVKRTEDFGEDMEMIAKTLSLKMMKENNTVFSDHTHIKRIEGKTVYAEKDGQNIQFNDIDIIVISTGMQSVNQFLGKFEGIIPYYLVGDADKIGNAQDAIESAYETAVKL